LKSVANSKPETPADAICRALKKRVRLPTEHHYVLATLFILHCHLYDAGKIPEELYQPQDDVTGPGPMRWYLFGYHKKTNHRVMLPAPFRERDNVAKLSEPLQVLVGDAWRLSIEQRSAL
jgi:hypothetical protein